MEQATAQSESPIMQALRLLDDGRKELHSEISQLGERLTPIICEPISDEEVQSDKRATKSIIDSRIMAAVDETEGDINYVRSLIKRLQI